MELKKTDFEGLVEIFPRILPDERGQFLESYNKRAFSDLGLNMNFVQDNMSFSKKDVLRGMHFQKAPSEQGKLVSVAMGKVKDIVLDMRRDSATFGQHKTFILDSERRNMIYVPVGFAHGFLAMVDSILSYKCTEFYNRNADSGLHWNDPELGIDWGIDNPIISEKDKNLPTFREVMEL